MPKFTSTPATESLYPAVQRSVNKYNSEEQEFRTTLVFDANDPYVKETDARFLALAKDELKKQAADAKPQKVAAMKKYAYASPFRPQVDEDGKETGKVLLNLKRPASVTRKRDGKVFNFTVKVFDSAGKPITKDIKIGSGTVMKASFEERPYVVHGTQKFGVSMQLQAVQIINLVEYVPGGNADSFGFDSEEGGFVQENESDEFFGGSSESESQESGNEEASSDAAANW